MNILFISFEYPPETGFGGIGTYTMHAAEAMATAGHMVHVISKSEKKESYETKRNGVHIHRVKILPYPLPTARIYYPWRRLCYRFFPHTLLRMAWAHTAYRAYLHLVDSGLSFDLIEFPECGGEGYYFRKTIGIKRIARLHTPWSLVREFNTTHEPITDRYMMSYMERRSVQAAHGVSSPSQSLANIMKSAWRLPNIMVYPNPIPSGLYQKSQGRDWIYTGRVEHRKGVHILLEAFDKLQKRNIPLPRLRLIGRPYGRLGTGEKYEDYIEKLIRKNSLQETITWIKGVDHQKLSEYLLRSSVAIFPSIWENFPYACLEAMACGLVIIASRCGGFIEMFDDGVEGFHFDSGSSDHLAHIIEHLISNPGQIQSIGDKAQKRLRSLFDSKTVSATIETFYSSIVNN